MATLCKFERNLNLSHKDIKGARAKMLVADAKDAQIDLVRDLTSKVRGLERQLLNLEDLHPDNVISLKVTKDNFDAKTWVKEYQKVKVDLKLEKAELAIAEDTLKEFFNE